MLLNGYCSVRLGCVLYLVFLRQVLAVFLASLCLPSSPAAITFVVRARDSGEFSEHNCQGTVSASRQAQMWHHFGQDTLTLLFYVALCFVSLCCLRLIVVSPTRLLRNLKRTAHRCLGCRPSPQSVANFIMASPRNAWQFANQSIVVLLFSSLWLHYLGVWPRLWFLMLEIGRRLEARRLCQTASQCRDLC